MFRHIIAATAVSLFATGAMAQNTIDRAGTGGDSTIDANAPRVDRLLPQTGTGSAAAPSADDSLAPQDANPTRVNPTAAARSADDSLAPQDARQSQATSGANTGQAMANDGRFVDGQPAGDEDAGAVRAGTYPGSTTDANSPTVDRIQPSTN